LDEELVARHNASRLDALRDDYAALSRTLERRGIAIDAIKDKAARLELALPSWGHRHRGHSLREISAARRADVL
jgi:L-rhamnose isomerase/sugar isomerase